jgi:hypothetical protein
VATVGASITRICSRSRFADVLEQPLAGTEQDRHETWTSISSTLEDPLVQLHAAHAERVLFGLVGAGYEVVQR